MGRDKLTLRLPGGDLLAERPARALTLTCRSRIAAHRLPQAAFLPAGFQPVADAEPGGGPLAGIVAALDAATTPWLLVAGGDMPELRADFLRAFMDLAEEDPSRALVIGRGRQLESLPLALPLGLAAEVCARFACGERAVRRAVPAARLRVVEEWQLRLEPGAQPWLSLNTPEQWQAYAGEQAALLS
jgi:molybdopterin-guanine dinucleotide biosynthesis protein A